MTKMIRCEISHVGEDDLIIVTGGTKPHIGAVVISTWEDNEAKIVSHGLPHHKEEALFIELAKVWSNTFQKTVIVSGGIHIDNASKEQIESLVDETWERFFHLMIEQKAKKPEFRHVK
ncbi:hypothetical protein SAMN05421736_10594 [Evansella caseinilytica]|uniref:Prenylated flavin chaperone LpdD-like domain-containing protein n=1 Tax=Evansella caseinilytica TaxID=1503961 RepID=A0A1H3PKY4_9BACI|nr:hypothetical protein [Evansella caseinilytica]SDZ01710.1 hypothetical protein SAMN05421736_10594 [Evansella caseinilytica]